MKLFNFLLILVDGVGDNSASSSNDVIQAIYSKVLPIALAILGAILVLAVIFFVIKISIASSSGDVEAVKKYKHTLKWWAVSILVAIVLLGTITVLMQVFSKNAHNAIGENKSQSFIPLKTKTYYLQ